MTNASSTGSALAEARARLRLTQTDVARAIGRSQRTISRWEEGTTTPTPNDTAKVADALAALNGPIGAWFRDRVGLPPAPIAAPPPVSIAERRRQLAWMIYAAAEAADISPKRLRTAVAEVARRTSEAGWSMQDVMAVIAE